MWESKGWISDCDPYGWFMWHCNFYLGRRCDDDERKIKRWMGVAGAKGRFNNQLINRIHYTNKKFDDRSVSPVIRQTLQHWGYHLTEAVYNEHISKK